MRLSSDPFLFSPYHHIINAAENQRGKEKTPSLRAERGQEKMYRMAANACHGGKASLRCGNSETE
jgi:hypothetical protein